eukprot:Gregarina_sp_Poly_1__132@NODE_102_length_14381_cov_59_883820_g89_i0_p12_GENE_NODE_102_length_14381_cov_59_883820_g89_i0NODE_102_length_14381_cov_59_883820_g89_i0_p12_ORF_typecomplete_len112_score27_83_NODE_102_length_14381_cov_59_883820_g89_i0568903
MLTNPPPQQNPIIQSWHIPAASRESPNLPSPPVMLSPPFMPSPLMMDYLPLMASLLTILVHLKLPSLTMLSPLKQPPRPKSNAPLKTCSPPHTVSSPKLSSPPNLSLLAKV